MARCASPTRINASVRATTGPSAPCPATNVCASANAESGALVRSARTCAASAIPPEPGSLVCAAKDKDQKHHTHRNSTARWCRACSRGCCKGRNTERTWIKTTGWRKDAFHQHVRSDPSRLQFRHHGSDQQRRGIRLSCPAVPTRGRQMNDPSPGQMPCTLRARPAMNHHVLSVLPSTAQPHQPCATRPFARPSAPCSSP